MPEPPEFEVLPSISEDLGSAGNYSDFSYGLLSQVLIFRVEN
jgi:hypothetical protein